MISKHIMEKAKTIVVVNDDETAVRIYFTAIWMNPKDAIRHEYKLDYIKDNEISLSGRVVCRCTWHSLYPEDPNVCAYKLAVLEELVKLKVLRREVIDTLYGDDDYG